MAKNTKVTANEESRGVALYMKLLQAQLELAEWFYYEATPKDKIVVQTLMQKGGTQ